MEYSQRDMVSDTPGVRRAHIGMGGAAGSAGSIGARPRADANRGGSRD